MNKIEENELNQLIDWMINSYEHCESIQEDAEFILNENPELTTKENLQNLMQNWLDNKDGIRINIALGSIKEEDVKEVVVDFIKRYI